MLSTHITYKYATASTTGPKLILILFSIFQIQLLAYNLEKCLHLVVAPRNITQQLTHGYRHLFFWHIELHCDGSQSNIHVFSLLTGEYPKTQDNWHTNQHIYHQMREYPKYLQYSECFPPICTVHIVETEANPKYSGLDTNTTANFSNNSGYTLQLQASTQPTMLRSVLEHTPNAITSV